MFERILIDLGLLPKEARVYLALLELGEASAQQISKKALVERPTTYVQLENLYKKGLVSIIEKGKKRYFSPEPPENLLNFFREKLLHFKTLEKELKNILPELNAIYNASPYKPKVKFFEGKKGLKAIQGDLLSSGARQIQEIYSEDDLFNVFTKQEMENFASKRVRKKIYGRAIYIRKKGPFEKRKYKELLVEARFIPKEKFPVKSDIIIYKGKTALASLKEPLVGVIIEDKNIYQTMKTLFELAWIQADYFDKISRKNKKGGRTK